MWDIHLAIIKRPLSASLRWFATPLNTEIDRFYNFISLSFILQKIQFEFFNYEKKGIKNIKQCADQNPSIDLPGTLKKVTKIIKMNFSLEK